MLQVLEPLHTSDENLDKVDGVACPIDPMERLQCESCQ